MNKSETEDLDMFDDDVDDVENEELIEEISNDNANTSIKTARSAIEIKRELLELRKLTGEYFDSDIFD